jgi:hypothetical protein
MYSEKGNALRLHHEGPRAHQEKRVFLSVLCALCGKPFFEVTAGKGSYSLPVLSSPGTWLSSRVEVSFAAR